MAIRAYVPTAFQMTQGEIRAALENLDAVDLVTPTAEGLAATYLPMLYDASIGEHGALLGHVALLNVHWKAQPTGESLVIAHQVSSYVSPGWYAAKAEHGKVVPTWNHLTLNIRGELVVHDDVEWLREIVTRLTDRHEASSAQPWQVTDAPPKFIDGQLRAIRGIELRITSVEAKAKLSQNRPEGDHPGIVAGLSARGQRHAARAVAEHTGLQMTDETTA